ncbi:hypothetical protein EPN44_10335 [bacterium]|nr:MAG: hypothetical protein EPN44_10335 [bacterium]
MAIFARAPLPLGVHLDAEGFALCEVRSTARGAELRRVVFEAFGGREPAEALTAAVHANGWRHRLCVTSLAAERALLHAVHLPSMPASERRAAARLEAERLAPDRDVALAVDLSALPGGWLLAAAPQAEVRAAAARAEAAGLRVRAVDVATLALARAIGAQSGDAIVDAGERRAVVHLVTEAVPFVRPLPSWGTCAELAAPLAEALEFAASRGFGAARRVVVAGTLALEDGIVERLASALGRAVSLAELRADVSADEHPLDYVRASAPRWLTACGLALWSLRSMASCA